MASIQLAIVDTMAAGTESDSTNLKALPPPMQSTATERCVHAEKGGVGVGTVCSMSATTAASAPRWGLRRDDEDDDGSGHRSGARDDDRSIDRSWGVVMGSERGEGGGSAPRFSSFDTTNAGAASLLVCILLHGIVCVCVCVCV